MTVLVSGVTSTGHFHSREFTDSTTHTHPYASHLEVLQGTKILVSRHSNTEPKHLEENKDYQGEENNRWYVIPPTPRSYLP